MSIKILVSFENGDLLTKDDKKEKNHMATQETLRHNSEHTIEVVFQVMRVVVNSREGQK